MSIPILRYALDKTGINPDNFVNNEPHNLQALKVRAIAPTYGAFFTESLRIYDTTTNLTLIRGQHYICTELLDTATEIYGKEICYLILIIDQNISNSISIKYQALGGPYTRSADAVVSLYNLIVNDTRNVDWMNIINKPPTFSPGQHLHDLGDLYGFEYLVNSMERIRSAILLADVPGNENLLAWVTDSLNSIRQSFASQFNQIENSSIIQPSISTTPNNALRAQPDGLYVPMIDQSSIGLASFNNHLINYNNPHVVTKEQVGLGLVENFGVANSQEAVTGVLINKLITPITLVQAIQHYISQITPNSLGIDQNWTDVTNSRVNNIYYTNITNKTIQVCINLLSQVSSDNVSFYVSNNLIGQPISQIKIIDKTILNPNPLNISDCIVCIIPPNRNYKIVTTAEIVSWFELR